MLQQFYSSQTFSFYSFHMNIISECVEHTDGFDQLLILLPSINFPWANFQWSFNFDFQQDIFLYTSPQSTGLQTGGRKTLKIIEHQKIKKRPLCVFICGFANISKLKCLDNKVESKKPTGAVCAERKYIIVQERSTRSVLVKVKHS